MGYIVDKEGLRTGPEKIETITIHIQISRYGRFVKDISTTAFIIKVIKGRQKKEVLRTSEAEKYFQKLKIILSSSPILSSPNFQEQFIIQTDASEVGLGAILNQGKGTDERVIPNATKSLSTTGKKYSATERELLAIIFGIEKFRRYVEGTHFQVITDHYY